jgi:hypothetical protein
LGTSTDILHELQTRGAVPRSDGNAGQQERAETGGKNENAA